MLSVLYTTFPFHCTIPRCSLKGWLPVSGPSLAESGRLGSGVGMAANSDEKKSEGATTSKKPDPAADQCAKCNKPLEEKSKLAFGKLYHMGCFTCTSCDTVMTIYTVHDGKPYCPLCTHTMLEPQCAECGWWLFGK